MTSCATRGVLAAAVLFLIAIEPATAAMDGSPPDGPADPSPEAAGPETVQPPGKFWLSLFKDHVGHVVLVYGASLLDMGIDSEIGPRASPLFWSSPPRFDTWIRNHYRRGPDDTGSHGFVENNVTPLTRGIAVASIVACNGKRWRDDVVDFLGLWEAQRFNTAITGIVKNLVGRERPRLEFAAEDGATSEEIAALERSDSNHQSFYSFHASSAFTTLAYTDLVISRRLHAHPAARRWIRGGLYALGSYIAWARVLQDGHYFSDVVTGSFAGIFTGRSFYGFNHHDGVDRWLSWDPRPSSRVTFSLPSVTHDGFVVAARIQL